MGGSIWDRFAMDPRREEHAHLRASDGDRELVNELLGTAYAEGRLTPDELDERLDAAAQAHTLGELPALLEDLVVVGPPVHTPSDRHVEAERRYRKQRQDALWQFLIPTVICWIIYLAATRGAMAWPVFVMLGTGVRYVRLVTNHADVVADIEVSLERKELRQLEQDRTEQGRRSSETNDG